MRVRLHELKINREHFRVVAEGVKTAELRKLDRDYRLEDYILLKEYNQGEYTGNELLIQISHILTTTEHGLQNGYGMLSFVIPEGVNKIMVRHKSSGAIGRIDLEHFRLPTDYVVNVTWAADITSTPKPYEVNALRIEKFFVHSEILHRADIIEPKAVI
jgi:hypothetical protein